MTKRTAAVAFVLATAFFTLVFVGLTVDSHTRFPALTNADAITPQVLEGKDVWHRNNCVNCHTLTGEGAYFAPDLTRITDQRGGPYLTAFLQDPARFYSEEETGRLMNTPGLDETEIEAVLAFLDWIARIDNQNWPPRPILVSGSALPGAFERGVSAPTAASDDPSELGEALFNSTPPGCFACHSTAPGVQLAGPSLAGIQGRTEALIEDDAYTGAASTAEEYLREAILEPSAHLVPGQVYSADGRSFMPDNYDETLTSPQVDQLVAYLMTLR